MKEACWSVESFLAVSAFPDTLVVLPAWTSASRKILSFEKYFSIYLSYSNKLVNILIIISRLKIIN